MGVNLGKLIEGAAFQTLNEFMADMRVNDGYARPSRYEVILYPPATASASGKGDEAVKLNDPKLLRRTSMRCSNISFPGRSLDTTSDTNIYGPTRQIVQGFSYEPITASFQMSSDLREKQFFEAWQKKSYDNETWSTGYYEDYIGSVEIYQLDESSKKRYGVRLVEAFPRNFSAQTLDYTPSNDIQLLNVEFSYRYWLDIGTEGKDGSKKGLSDRIVEIATNSAQRQILSQLPSVVQKLL